MTELSISDENSKSNKITTHCLNIEEIQRRVQIAVHKGEYRRTE